MPILRDELAPSIEDVTHKLARLAERPPFLDPELNATVLTGYAAVKAAILDRRLQAGPRLGNVASIEAADCQPHDVAAIFISMWPAFSEGEYHRKIRKLLAQALPREITSSMRESFENEAVELIDGLRGEGTVDWVEQFVRPYTVHMLSLALGVPGSVVRSMLVPADAVMTYMSKPREVRTDAVAEEAANAIHELRHMVCQHILQSPNTPLTKSISRIALEQDLGEWPAVASATQIITGSLAPMQTVLCDGLILVADNIFGNSEILEAPTASHIVEESLRLGCPFRFAVRTATSSLALGSIKLDTHETAFLGLASASVDKRRFPTGGDFDFTTFSRSHLAFGAGNHYCLGASIARAALGAVFEYLTRLEGVRVCEPPTRNVDFAISQIDSLLVQLH